MNIYHSPVADLLDFEACQPVKADQWPDYVSTFGFTQEHVPQLLQLMQDEELLDLDLDDPPVLPAALDPELVQWGPVHAWRALGQLQAVEVVDGMIAVFDTSGLEWAMEEFPPVCQLIGPPVIEPIGNLLQEYAGTETKINTLVECLYLLPKTFPETRDRCAEILMTCLENFEQNEVMLNTLLVNGLVELKVTTALPLMEKVYQADRVEQFFAGSWAKVQIDLGLKTEADFTPEELAPKITPEMENLANFVKEYQRSQLPDAFSVGLPLDPALFSRPLEFDDLLQSQPSLRPSSPKGFGSGQKSQTKGKKKKR